MGIDHIGGKGPPVPPVGAGGVSHAGAPTAPFPAPEATAAAPAAPATGVDTTTLERLRSGELTLDGYLDAKVAEATGHLVGLPPAVQESIRDALREQLASDPGLADLVQTVRGSAPPGEGERA
jgi:hypothetical protein